MIDREKVIKGLEYCTQHGRMCGRDCNGHWGWTDDSYTSMERLDEYRTKCSYGNCKTGCVRTLAKDALALLKVHEPKRVGVVNNGFTGLPVTHCPKCHRPIDMFYGAHGVETEFCPWCGQAVKWE